MWESELWRWCLIYVAEWCIYRAKSHPNLQGKGLRIKKELGNPNPQGEGLINSETQREKG